MLKNSIETLRTWLLFLEGIAVWLQVSAAILVLLLFVLARGLFTNLIFQTALGLSYITKNEMGSKILISFQNPMKALILVIGVYISLLIMPLNGVYDVLDPIYRSLFIYFMAWGFYNLADNNNFCEVWEKYGVDKILVDFISKVLRVLVIILATVMIVQTWGYNVGGFLAGLGLGGLAFALAAQDTVANVFGGIMIILDKPFSVGDWIETPSVEGSVEEMTFRSTKVRTFAHALVSVPNSVIANQPLTNWTKMGKRRVTFHLGVTYSTPVESIKNCVERIRTMLENHQDINQETLFVRFDRFSDSSLDIFLYYFTNTTKWGEYLQVKEEINFMIMEILQEEGVSVAFPSQSIYLEN